MASGVTEFWFWVVWAVWAVWVVWAVRAVRIVWVAWTACAARAAIKMSLVYSYTFKGLFSKKSWKY